MSAEPTPFAGVRARKGAASARASVLFSSENSLADADGSLSLPVIARLCRERGYLFPLARPLPPLTLAEACARLPFLVDAYVSSLDAVTASGEPLSTGRAPRAATGPDLVGAICARPPLATCVRARVRVLDARTARCHVARSSDVRDAVSQVAALLGDGRAFSVSAFCERGPLGTRTFVVRVIGGPAAFSARAGAALEQELPALVGRAGWGDATAPSFGRARSLLPGDDEAMRDALLQGARVVAAPLMGRAAMLAGAAPTDADISTMTVGEGAAALANALRSAGGRRG